VTLGNISVSQDSKAEKLALIGTYIVQSCFVTTDEFIHEYRQVFLSKKYENSCRGHFNVTHLYTS